MYSISEVAKLSELTARTLRHYEEKDLITSSRRGQNGYRYYSAEVIARIAEIKKFKRMEFSLDEIKSFIDFNGEQLENVLNHKFENKLGITVFYELPLSDYPFLITELEEIDINKSVEKNP